MLLLLQNISFTFPGKNHLLNNVSLTFEENKIYALMGANGSGKTTLFNLLTGFIEPQSGEIIFRNENITHRAPYKINSKGIGRTFQDLRLITKLSVKENILLAMQNNPSDSWLNALLPENFHRKSNEELEKRANKIIAQFFLSDVKNSLAAEISYGQQKLLTLACCMANGAEILLLDEPVAGINPEYRNKVAQLLKQLRKERKTVLLIEHNTDFISEVADHLFFLNEGKMYSYENLEKLKTDPLVMEAYI